MMGLTIKSEKLEVKGEKKNGHGIDGRTRKNKNVKSLHHLFPGFTFSLLAFHSSA